MLSDASLSDRICFQRPARQRWRGYYSAPKHLLQYRTARTDDATRPSITSRPPCPLPLTVLPYELPMRATLSGINMTRPLRSARYHTAHDKTGAALKQHRLG